MIPVFEPYIRDEQADPDAAAAPGGEISGSVAEEICRSQREEVLE